MCSTYSRGEHNEIDQVPGIRRRTGHQWHRRCRFARYGDLNLHSQAGVKSLHKRIRNAAESVCSELSTGILSLRGTYDQCVEQAVTNGVAEVANPNLSNFHRSKGKSAVLASN
jgi:UrcA family protein